MKNDNKFIKTGYTNVQYVGVCDQSMTEQQKQNIRVQTKHRP